MKTPNTIEDDIDRIRLKIYEETKNLTDAQWAERLNKIGETAAKKYGFKTVPNAPSRLAVNRKQEALV
ncbi:MAG: hypothetical protein FWF84_01720 [Kiritimatiellaeota bacterium]|nr:hypothetical protein [Kiritimatiellota bacterium]